MTLRKAYLYQDDDDDDDDAPPAAYAQHAQQAHAHWILQQQQQQIAQQQAQASAGGFEEEAQQAQAAQYPAYCRCPAAFAFASASHQVISQSCSLSGVPLSSLDHGPPHEEDVRLLTVIGSLL